MGLQYTFPPQPQVIDACAELARRIVNGLPTGTETTMIDGWVSTKEKAASSSDRILVLVG